MPENFSFSADFLCPEMCGIKAGRASCCELVDATAHDVWSLGYLMLWLLTGLGYFSAENAEGNITPDAVYERQDDWVSYSCMLTVLAFL